MTTDADRVSLTVSVAAGGFGTSDTGEAEADLGLARLAIRAQIDELAAAGVTWPAPRRDADEGRCLQLDGDRPRCRAR